MSSRTPKKDSQSLKKNLQPNKFFPFFPFLWDNLGLPGSGFPIRIRKPICIQIESGFISDTLITYNP
jgi:hypothetical protein